jgi:GGDEF domain-containing protein
VIVALVAILCEVRHVVLGLLERRRLLGGFSVFVYAAVFATFVVFERPGLGVAHGFYVAIVLAGIATGPLGGALAGVLATLLYAIGIVVNPHVPPADIPTVATAIRLLTFVLVGTMIGYFASTSRRLLGSANELMAELMILAKRDFLTGLPNQRAFETTISSFLQRCEPFVLLIGETEALARLSHGGNRREREDLLLDFAEQLCRAAGAEAEITRTGNEQLGIVAPCADGREAGQLAAKLERALDEARCRATFGWATCPRDGDNALALFTAASERLYARKIVRGDRRPDAARHELVDELLHRRPAPCVEPTPRA